MEVREDMKTLRGRLVSLVPPSVKKRLGALKGRIEEVKE
jgi:hypothetical protein